ncbi:M48 family metallopeptidase [Salimicrobium humidisoli]|uniref:M48 family metallopeptidase n=1 Tax=Salimicrobium humidisoli TaxID=2029857 RepID=UPI001E5A2BAD|nr:M48 family metallopeptidase [Salimicrobium humidisoli]
MVVRKKFLIWTLIIYLTYTLGVLLYLFVLHDPGVPQAAEGSAADPAQFLGTREAEEIREYATLRHLLYLLTLPVEWLIYTGVLVFGLAYTLKKAAFSKLPLYVFFLSGLVWVLTLPVSYAGRRLSLSYDVSVEPFSKWLQDHIISFSLDTLLMITAALVLYRLIRMSAQRWWLYAWLLLVPFLAFFMYIQPVLIDPLYNEFDRLSDSQLEERILSLAGGSGVPADRVYVVDKSEETNALNAYVNGIGDNLRIVLWDTTLRSLEEEEVLFIMAHEIGHYVKNHLLKSLFGALAGSFIGLYLLYRLLPVLLHRFGSSFRIKGTGDIASLPLILLLVSLLSFLAQPVEMAVSRQAERAADEYALEQTGDPDAAVGAFQEMIRHGKSDVHPPALIKYLRYGHPTMLERIRKAEE